MINLNVCPRVSDYTLIYTNVYSSKSVLSSKADMVGLATHAVSELAANSAFFLIIKTIQTQFRRLGIYATNVYGWYPNIQFRFGSVLFWTFT